MELIENTVMNKFIFLFFIGLFGCVDNKTQVVMTDTNILPEENSELKEFYDGMSKLRLYCKEVVALNNTTDNTLNFKRCDCAIDILISSMLEADADRKKGYFDNQKFENDVAEKIKQQCGKVPNIFY